ncbi:hypothetical protein DFH06DRAFT_1344875 [Mycena polygramma]|nr:hypothetical protein DFH06DRAFT_1347563 [Mycena polygramma]KAJ7612957.1 hypothetical protein DFH06DRAFT_1344875 [Mycena polygramma]
MSDPASDSSAAPAVFVPAFPFANAPGADAILQSSDGADFYVHRHILALHPTNIPLQENSAVLDRALRFFYPGVLQPPAMTLDELRGILEVLVSKYDMECVVSAAKTQLESYIESQPIAVVVRSTAPPELDHIPASAYHNLLYYHKTCAENAQWVTQVLRWIPAQNEFVWFTCTSCVGETLNWYLSDGVGHPVRKWFIEYVKALGDVLVQTPGIDPRQHKTMLDALAAASKCTFCRGKVFDQLPLMSPILLV